MTAFTETTASIVFAIMLLLLAIFAWPAFVAMGIVVGLIFLLCHDWRRNK
jgi:hypothetical protein